MYSFYAFGFYMGSVLIVKQIGNYNAGDVLSCFYGIMFGIFSFAQVMPNLKAVIEGKAGA